MKTCYKINNIVLTAGIISGLFISGCTQDQARSDVQNFLSSIDRQVTEKVPQLPVLLEYSPYTYSAASLRSPFQAPQEFSVTKKMPSATQPDFLRKKEYLEYLDLEQLKMVGTIKNTQSNELWALINEKDEAVHRIRIGQHLGKNHGKVVSITPQRVDVVEIVPDGDEQWIERPRQIVLTN